MRHASALLACLAVASLAGCPRPPEPPEVLPPGHPPAEPPPVVANLAISTAGAAPTLAYRLVGVGCTDCVPPAQRSAVGGVKQVMQQQVRAYQPGLDGGAAVQLFAESANQDLAPGSFLAGTSGGEVAWFALDAADGGLLLVRTEEADGGVVAVALDGVGKQTQSTSFGSLVRHGVATGAGAAAGAAARVTWLLGASSEDGGRRLKAFQVASDGGVLRAVSLPDGAHDAVLAAYGDVPAAAWLSPSADGGAERVTVRVQSAAAAPQRDVLEGAPMALWTDAKSFRVGTKHADCTARFSDGKSPLEGPRAEADTCTAAAFGPDGAAYLLWVDGQGVSLWAQRDGGLEKSVLEPAVPQLTVGFRACALAAGPQGLELAWTEGDPSLEGHSGWGTVVQQRRVQYTTLSNVLKTKHDTVKNSINNVR